MNKGKEVSSVEKVDPTAVAYAVPLLWDWFMQTAWKDEVSRCFAAAWRRLWRRT